MNEKTTNYTDRLRLAKGNSYKLIGPYTTMKTKTTFRHTDCGYEWDTSPDNMLRSKKGCPRCSGNARVTTESYKAKVYDLVADEYSVIGNYVNARTPIQIAHNVCGHSWCVQPDSFTNGGSRCPKCFGTIKVTQDEVNRRVLASAGPEYLFIKSEGLMSRGMCYHETCGYTWGTTPYNVIVKGIRCPKCGGNAKSSLSELQNRVDNMYGQGEYTFEGPYVNNITPIRCSHKCGHSWNISPGNILSGRECPSCHRTSKGERMVANILEGLGIQYSTEHTFDDCRHKSKLRFDFFLQEMKAVIEYDGEQHYKPVNFGGMSDSDALDNLKNTVLRDTLKTNYCLDKGIPLLRIPYSLSDQEVKDLVVKFIESRK